MEIYDLLIPEDYQSPDDGQKTKFYQAGVAFKNGKSEGFTLKIPDGMSLSGKVLMMSARIKSKPESLILPSLMLRAGRRHWPRSVTPTSR